MIHSSTMPAPRSAIDELDDFRDFGAALAEGFARRIGELSARLGASAEGVRWARRAAFAASRATSAGHVCMPVARLARRYGATAGQTREALFASGVVSDGRGQGATSSPLVVDAAGRLYLARYFDYERRLAAAIVAHASQGEADHAGSAAADANAGSESSTLYARLARYFGPPSTTDDIDWQRAAASLALSSRMTVVSGGPGTGKTTTVVGMLACLLDEAPERSIALAAPTGKAAQRMQEALAARAATLPPEIEARLPRGAQTLHRLLGAGQGGARLRHHRDNPLPYDVLVVDEASMIDVAMAMQLFDALAPTTRLIMLGDKDQLAAVEAGAVFAELSARPAFSAPGIARIAGATGLDEACVEAALAGLGDSAQAPSSEPQAQTATASFDDEFFRSADEVDFDLPPSDEDAPALAGFDRGSDAAEGTAEWIADDALGDASEAIAQPIALPLVDCVVWLERNYRFGLDSAIGRLSLAIRRGDAEAALAALAPADGSDEADGAKAVAVLDEDAGAPLAAHTVERLARGFAPYAAALEAALVEREPDPVPLFDALNAFRILCATRVGARGVDALNALMAAHVRRAARVPLAPGASWFPGRPVMIARNDYGLGLFNGDIGIALPGAGGALRVHFRTVDSGLRAVTPAALPPHDTAFALTVHKSQGSEFDEAALVLPASTSRVLSRELVYTAVTRAREAVRIVGSRAVLADAIVTPTRRDSGLAARMAEALLGKSGSHGGA
jgi:exodeoxyribonuclease V alpha subunit